MERIARHPAAWIALGIALALILRAPWLHAAFGRDEGGVAYIAARWSHSSPFPYGEVFLDRPPLIVLLYKLAQALGGALGIRVLGAVAAALTVALVTLLAVELGGRRAAPVAAVVGAVMLSSAATGSVFTPGEQLAVVPSAASVLCLVAGLGRRGRRALLLLALAGALSFAALLVKQSFGDALVAGAVAIAATWLVRERPRREVALGAAAYAGGALVVFAGLLAWSPGGPGREESLWYALIGFRLDAVHALTGSSFGQNLSRLAAPSLGSGLVVALAATALALALARVLSPTLRIALAAWALAGLVGVLLGGSYWAHYLIQLVPVATVGAALAAVRWPRAGTAAAAVLVLVALAVTAQAIRRREGPHFQRNAVAVGRYVKARAEPGQTLWVQYARTNVLYYAGLRDPFPFNWSLMMQSVPAVQQRLRALLASPARPTWIVQWQRTRSFGLDRDGATKRLLAGEYRRVARVCGRRVLLARGSPARPAPPRLRCS